MRNTRNKPGGKAVRDQAGAHTHLVWVTRGCGAAAGNETHSRARRYTKRELTLIKGSVVLFDIFK